MFRWLVEWVDEHVDRWWATLNVVERLRGMRAETRMWIGRLGGHEWPGWESYSEVGMLDAWFSFRRLRKELGWEGTETVSIDYSFKSPIAGRNWSSVPSWSPILYPFSLFLEIVKVHTYRISSGDPSRLSSSMSFLVRNEYIISKVLVVDDLLLWLINYLQSQFPNRDYKTDRFS